MVLVRREASKHTNNSKMDPLTVLREFVIDKRLDDVTESEDGKRIHFGDRYSFPKVSLADPILGNCIM